jgi:hypothetical protein
MHARRISRKKESGTALMAKYLIMLMLVCASLSVYGNSSYGAPLDVEPQNSQNAAAESVNPVVQWNRTLLVIVRTPGAQPATVHPTRSLRSCTPRSSIFDAVNAIDRTH